jgi:hypothetical protein
MVPDATEVETDEPATAAIKTSPPLPPLAEAAVPDKRA